MKFKYLFPLLLSVAALAQDKPAPKLSQPERDLIAKKYSDYNYSLAELREYISDLQAKHPGFVLNLSPDGVWEYKVKPPAPEAPKPEVKK